MRYHKIDKGDGAREGITQKQFEKAVRDNYSEAGAERIIKASKTKEIRIAGQFYLYEALK